MLLEPYVHDITPAYLIHALKNYDPEATADSGPPQMLNKHQMAKVLGVSVYTMTRMARQGEIDAVKVGQQWRFPVDAVEKMRRAENV